MRGAGDGFQSAKYLPYKHEDLVQIPSTHVKPGTVVCICNFSVETEIGRSLELTGQPAE